MIEECFVCGDELEDGVTHEHEHVVIRDGARGQYLTPLFVFDVVDLVPEGKVPEDIVRLANRWLNELVEVSGDESQVVQDWVTYTGSQLLSDAGYIDVWEDGYVIFRRELVSA